MIRYIYIFIYIYISYHPIYIAKCSGADKMIFINRIDNTGPGPFPPLQIQKYFIFFVNFIERMERGIICWFIYGTLDI